MGNQETKLGAHKTKYDRVCLELQNCQQNEVLFEKICEKNRQTISELYIENTFGDAKDREKAIGSLS